LHPVARRRRPWLLQQALQYLYCSFFTFFLAHSFNLITCMYVGVINKTLIQLNKRSEYSNHFIRSKM
jgi:hypothetical protein